MIPASCIKPRCPIFTTCERKFGFPASCLHRPAPFVALHLPDDMPNPLSALARQEHELRKSMIDGGD